MDNNVNSVVGLSNISDIATKGIVSQTDVSCLFFSEFNINLVHDAMRSMVYQKTNKTIDRQSNEVLFKIMRYTYLTYGKNDNRGFEYVKREVKMLNTYVLDFCIDEIVKEMAMNDFYVRDRSSQPIPLAHGDNTSITGTKTSEFKSFF
jgi:hypothetical protein